MLPQPGSAERVGISESSGMAGPPSASLLVLPSREGSWAGGDYLRTVFLHYRYAIACSAHGFILKGQRPNSLGL